MENGVGIDHARTKGRTRCGGKNGLRRRILQQDIKRGCCARSLVDPSQTDGHEVVLERVFRGGKDAAVKDRQIRLRCRGGDGAHDQGEILLCPAPMEHLQHIVSRPGRKHTGCNPYTLNVVDIVRSPARGCEPLTEVVPKPLRPVGTNEDKVEVVDQTSFTLRCDSTAGFVRPSKGDVKAVRWVE